MGKLVTALRSLGEHARVLVGLGSLVLILAGIWGIWGWPWAAIAGGVPGFGFYLWGEVRVARTPPMEV